MPARVSTKSTAKGAVVHRLPFALEVDLVEGVRARDPAALEAFYDRYAALVLRVLARILGADADLKDLQHDVFVRAFASIDALTDPSAVKSWVVGVAVFTAKACIQRRVRRRWLRFFAPEEMPEVEAVAPGDEVREALRATYWALDKLDADDRIAFSLRVIDGMELTDVAAACGVSLATIKRRLTRAEKSFLEIAMKHPVLAEWVEGGARWQAR